MYQNGICGQFTRGENSLETVWDVRSVQGVLAAEVTRVTILYETYIRRAEKKYLHGKDGVQAKVGPLFFQGMWLRPACISLPTLPYILSRFLVSTHPL